MLIYGDKRLNQNVMSLVCGVSHGNTLYSLTTGSGTQFAFPNSPKQLTSENYSVIATYQRSSVTRILLFQVNSVLKSLL